MGLCFAMTHLISITSDALTARINPHGAELWSLADAEGREYMTDGDPAFWTGHAPLLFPIVGALNAGRYRLGDATYELPRHGFARTRAFDVAEQREGFIRFHLADDAATRAVYPFAFALDMIFRLDGWTLRMEARVTNTGAQALPFSFGYHPAFAWPLPGGAAKEAHRITFVEPEPGPLRLLDSETGLVLADQRSTPVSGREIAPDAALFEADALIWDELASRHLTWGAPGGAHLDIAFPDTSMLGIWQKPGANYLCIEPWQGHADPAGYAGDFHDKPGIVILPPGRTERFRMDVTVRPA